MRATAMAIMAAMAACGPVAARAADLHVVAMPRTAAGSAMASWQRVDTCCWQAEPVAWAGWVRLDAYSWTRREPQRG
jgi:hypothetical protein